ncbi:OLC1v1021857C1 [Oldenlandia corymbosa var. corymbosa]|nr:OLC1v1021857C1 [Oldenlandia corymbosa var. corymbosa]
MNNMGVSSLGVGASSGAVLSSGGHTVSGPHPNAWGHRKETAPVKETAPAPWSVPDAALKLAHASALEKVSSGRWLSKQQSNSQTDVELIRQPETETDFYSRHKDIYSKNDHISRDVVGGMEYNSAALARQVGKSLTLDDNVRAGAKEVLTLDRSRTPVTLEANERNSGIQQLHLSGKPGGSELQSAPQSELTERPKLKLLPRSKPLENLEPPMEYKPVPQQPTVPVPVQVDNQSQSRGVPNPPKAGNLGSEGAHSTVERPKLNLKPRSEPFDPTEVDNENKRNTVFGGARPRELVLKDRGSDIVAVNNDDLVQPPQRVKQDGVRTERVSVHAASTRYTDKHENIPVEHRTGRYTDRREHKLEGEGADPQRKNWRGENWRNKREFDKPQRQQQQQHQQQQERPPSPDTWRKPVEQATPAPSDAQGVRFGKAASAVELAQAFSRPISDPTTADRASGQRNLPGRGQIPFSRLTGPAPRPQINGY